MVLVVGADEAHRRAVAARRAGRPFLAAGPKHRDAGVDDLRRAAVVDRQVDDLDAREAAGHVEQQVGVGAVEAVDRLRRVADQEEVAPSAVEQLDEPLLDRVEVLGLVDEDVAEPVADAVGPAGVAGELVDAQREQVVEVDHAASALERGVGVERGGDLRRRRCRATPCGPGRAGVAVGRHAARRGPRRLGGQRRHRDAAGDLAEQAMGIVGDGRRAAALVEPTLAQEAEGDAVERAGFDVVADAGAQQPAAQLAGGLAGERQRQRVAGVGGADLDAVGDAPGEHPRLARPGAGDDGDEA